jgi:IS4 transposase
MSRSHRLRFWYFGSSSLLYNCWRLVNVLLRVESPETHEKPAIPAADVVEFVRREAGIG